ncbi:MAG: hypothetical protein ACRC3Z_07915 [Phocaeicola sp.]
MKTVQFDTDNRPGLSRLFAIPLTSFLRIRPDYRNNTNHLEVKARDQIIDIILDTSAFAFNEEQATEEPGETYKLSIEGRIPKLSKLNDSVIRTLERGQWLVLHQDSNGTIQLSGSMDDPLSFHTTKTSGVGADSVNGTSFQFSGVTPSPSLIIDMVLITDL